MATRTDRVATLMSKRLVHAARIQEHVINEFEARYSQYIYGQPWFETEAERLEHFKRTGESTDGERIKRGYDTTSIPLHGKMRSVMMPYLMANDPVWINRQRRGADALEMAKVDLYADLSRIIWEVSHATPEVQRALDDAFCYRVGWMKTVYDTREKLPLHCWVDTRDMLVDCETRSPRLADRRWIAERMTLPIDTAKYFAKHFWDNPNYEFQPLEFEAIEGSDDGDARQVRGGTSRRSEYEDAPTEFVRIVMVQVRGQNPYTMSANYKSRAMNDPAGKDDVYDGKDHVLILEARGGFLKSDGYRLIGRTDWAFPCKRGQFTYTPLMLTKDNRSFYPYSIMQPAHSVQVASDMSLQAHNTDARLSARRWIALSDEAFPDQAEAERIVMGDDALMVARVKNQADPNRILATGNFGSPNHHNMQTFALNRENYESIQGMNKFDVQVRANQTALNTSIQNESAQVKVEDLAQLVERSIVEMAEKGVMCARANMTNDDVAKWINIPTTVDGKEVQRAMVTSRGGSEGVNDLWPNDPDWDDVRREVEVNLEPRSIRFRNPEKEAEDLRQVFEYQISVDRILGDTIAKRGVGVARAIAQRANEMMKLYCTLKNIVNYERVLFDVDAIVGPEPEPVDPTSVMQMQADQAAQQQQAPGVNPQQAGAATRMEQQGVDPASLPQVFQG